MPRIREAVIIAVFAAIGATRATAQADDSTLIASAQRASVRTLDSTFAATPFAQWLATLRPLPASRVHWGVNDCGEVGPPAIFMLFAIVGETTLHFKTLAEWAAFVRPRRP